MRIPARPSVAIPELTSAVFDTGRRGSPRNGCDCEQCFGYCLIDRDEAMRALFDRGVSSAVLEDKMLQGKAPLDFNVEPGLRTKGDNGAGHFVRMSSAFNRDETV